MKEKWKDLARETGLMTAGVAVEAAWTGTLVWATSKIPYVGIPIAVLLGTVGGLCTLYLVNGGRICYEDWKERYCSTK